MNYQEITDLASDKSNDLTDIFNDLLDEIEDSPHETTKDLYICSNTIYDIMEICKTNGYTLVLERGSILLDKYQKEINFILKRLMDAKQILVNKANELNQIIIKKKQAKTIDMRKQLYQTTPKAIKQLNRGLSAETIANNAIASQNGIMINLSNQNTAKHQVIVCQSKQQKVNRNPQVICQNCQSKVLKYGLIRHMTSNKCRNYKK